MPVAITAPPRSYASVSRLKSLFLDHATVVEPPPPPPPPAFAVPNEFGIAPQKGFKSNSWFTSETQSKSIRRVASAPNTKLLQQQQLQQHQKRQLHQTSASSLRAPSASPLPPLPRTCRRMYSSNSIKIKQVEVGPSSFVKIRMLGKGDVGHVHMVQQKDTGKLYAMKGKLHYSYFSTFFANFFSLCLPKMVTSERNFQCCPSVRWSNGTR